MEQESAQGLESQSGIMQYLKKIEDNFSRMDKNFTDLSCRISRLEQSSNTSYNNSDLDFRGTVREGIYHPSNRLEGCNEAPNGPPANKIIFFYGKSN
jgi:hypothetical protein